MKIRFRLNELKAKARQRPISELGLAHRSKRPIEVEAVFGQLKSNNKFNRFILRGKIKVEIEFGLMALAHNLRKLAVKALEKGLRDIFELCCELYQRILLQIRQLDVKNSMKRAA